MLLSRWNTTQPLNKLHFELIDSTNSYARRNANELPLPCLITADAQSNGRGRRGKSFFSPNGTGLYMTVLFSPQKELSLITPAAAVSVCEALEKFGVFGLGIKWVNDIFLNSKKICGILCERFFENGTEFVSVGIGINLTTEKFPPELKIAGSIKKSIPKKELSLLIAKKILEYAACPKESEIAEKYKKRLFFLGKEIEYIRNGHAYTATAVGINGECNLKVLLPDGKEEILSSGEISIKI